jgi:subtilisin family serine protease
MLGSIVRSTLLVLLLLSVVPRAGAETVTTRCATEVLHMTPDIDVRRLGTCSDDTSENALWFLDRLDSVDGSSDGRFVRTGAGSSALVYVLDTGIEIDHDEFANGNVIDGIDVQRARGQSPNCSSPNEAIHPCFDGQSQASFFIFSHGTGVASLIGGRHVGVAPGVRIISMTALGTPEVSNWLFVLNAVIQKAWDPSTPNVRTAVINMSSQLSGDGSYAAVEQKIRDMVGGVDRNGNPDSNGKRFVFVVAAGNTGAAHTPNNELGQCDSANQVHLFPAVLGPSIAGVITVGGIGKDNKLWSDTCRGPAVELLAPAEDIMAATISGKDHYRKTLSSGTSFSTPIVSGAAAQLLGREPNLTPAEVEQRLEATPSFITGPAAGTSGKVVYIVYPPEPRRRAVR